MAAGQGNPYFCRTKRLVFKRTQQGSYSEPLESTYLDNFFYKNSIEHASNYAKVSQVVSSLEVFETKHAHLAE
jgi:hypothetical protein